MQYSTYSWHLALVSREMSLARFTYLGVIVPETRLAGFQSRALYQCKSGCDASWGSLLVKYNRVSEIDDVF